MRVNRTIPSIPAQRTHRAARGGFSLIELVMVITIISILAAIAVPRYAGALARYRADAAAQRIIADLDYARELARSTSTTVEVRVKSAADKVKIMSAPDLKDPTDVYTTLLAEAPYRADIVSRDFGGDSIIYFDGYGNPDSGGSTVITVGSETRTITLNADSGKAVVE